MALKRAGVILVAEKYDEYMAKLRDVNKAHQETFGKKPTNKVAEAMDDGKKKAQEFAAASAQLKGGLMQLASGNVTGGIQTIISSLGVLKFAALAVAAAFVAIKLGQFALEGVEVATRNETLGVVLNNVGKNAGYTAEQVSAATSAVKAMGITTSAARKTLTDMAQAGIEWTNSAKLARVAQDAAVIGNIDSSEAFQRMIYGIKSGQTEILRNIGLQVSMEQAYRKAATQLGKNVNQLTEQEKVQARANAVIEEGAKIAGTYEAAMGTAGKMQSSMVRYIEETKNSVGNMLLPLKTLIVEMQYNFWKGASQAAKGLEIWGATIQNTIGLLINLRGASKDVKGPTLGERLGKAFHDAGRALTQLSLLARATVGGIAEVFNVLDAKMAVSIVRIFAMINAARHPEKALEYFAAAEKRIAELQPIAGRDVGQAFMDGYEKAMKAGLGELADKFPDWEAEYGAKAPEIDLSKRISQSEELIEQLNKEKEALIAQAQVMQKVKGIYEQYSKALSQAAKSRDKSYAQADKDYAKARESLESKTGKALVDLIKDSGKSRQQIIKDYNKQVVEQERQRNRDLEQERRRYELSKLQATRQFQLSERRLMAEGDILGLQRLREDFDLQRQEAGENFNLQNQERKETAQDQARQQQQEMRERLRELEENIAERRGQVFESYQTEMQELAAANEEKKAQIAEAYQEQLDNAKAARDEQLQALGEALKNEQTMTKEGMDAIAKILAETFGEQGAADALMKGWSERATDSVSVAMDNIINKIKNIENRIRNLQEGTTAATSGAKGGPHAAPLPGSYGMRQGGVGVVTGPALFEVEPGVREAFAFAPIPLGGTRAMQVNVGGGIDVRGAGGASPGIVDAAVQQTMSEITLAFRALSRRR